MADILTGKCGAYISIVSEKQSQREYADMWTIVGFGASHQGPKNDYVFKGNVTLSYLHIASTLVLLNDRKSQLVVELVGQVVQGQFPVLAQTS